MSLEMSIDEIRTMLPHRYPFLMIDRVLELTPGEKILALKNVSINEEFFNGHFPGRAVMPGVLITESMAQAAGLMLLSIEEFQGRIVYLASIDKMRFRKPVVPGDALMIEATMIWRRGALGKVVVSAKVDNQVAASGEMSFAIKEEQLDTRPLESRSKGDLNSD